MKITLHGTLDTAATFCLNTRELQILSIISVGSTVAERSFFCNQMDNWLRNSILTELSRNLAIMAVHDHTIFILKNRHMQYLCDHPPS